MVFNYALKIFSFIPKWVIILVVACGLSYLIGKSHGREPYKLAAELQNQKLDDAAANKPKNSNVKKQEELTIDQLKDFECIVTGDVANLLSNVR